ncbi:unnamed protein product [Protopolystoma xenopodis]|uniref:Uncharacterized protein n=1 Tax=Protopolystoma xenopodis TaxID=117903 RepID=A0A3S5B1A3_9PLAT|nr:unnamed protein product [Protopolystoma xenopodis]
MHLSLTCIAHHSDDLLNPSSPFTRLHHLPTGIPGSAAALSHNNAPLSSNIQHLPHMLTHIAASRSLLLTGHLLICTRLLAFVSTELRRSVGGDGGLIQVTLSCSFFLYCPVLTCIS